MMSESGSPPDKRIAIDYIRLNPQTGEAGHRVETSYVWGIDPVYTLAMERLRFGFPYFNVIRAYFADENENDGRKGR